MQRIAMLAHSPALALLIPCRQCNGVNCGNKGKVCKGVSLYEYPLLEQLTELYCSEWVKQGDVGMCKHSNARNGQFRETESMISLNVA